ncbi:NADH-quinone oxidoreductase subunit C [Candidatus Uhrbacteria bacterium]|nr:NADH-quinone oxidoreductase subunit C [Candidatus Uhrbacteria bacterium]
MTYDELTKIFPGLVKSHKDQWHLVIDHNDFTATAVKCVKEMGFSLSLLYATDDSASQKGFGIHAVLSQSAEPAWFTISTQLNDEHPTYQSLTTQIMASHWYERYLMDMFGIEAMNHPDGRRLVHHENIPEKTYPLRKEFKWDTKLAHANVAYPMHHVEGEGIYEIPVGPIHAGIIEPGHFRFNVAGERIITLEGKLFFTHKGVEKLLEGKTPSEALPFIERLSGDMAASHALAFCQAVEKICSTDVPLRAQMIRSLVCELERITMHIHDLANIAGMGTGYTVMAAQGFRIKERLMRLSQTIFGNRFWRGFIIPGGVLREFTSEERLLMKETTQEAVREMLSLIKMAMLSDGLRERLETTGILQKEAAVAYGAVGLPARASGVNKDVRTDHPYAGYGQLPFTQISATDGDVYARYRCRFEELDVSLEMILAALDKHQNTKIQTDVLVKDGNALSAVESWRGEIMTVVHLKDGVIDRCMPRDPSFCNWALFGEIGPGNIVPDFPLCNKSLNLSYSGNDL